MKVYQSIRYVLLTLWFTVGGKKIQVKFIGGQSTPKKVGGKFKTSDPALQKAMESSPSFGREYICIEGQTVDEPTPQTTKVPVVSVVETTVQRVVKTPEVPPVPPADPPIVNIHGITNAQGAKNYIMQNHKGFTNAQLKTKPMILEAAAGLKIAFPDWPE